MFMSLFDDDYILEAYVKDRVKDYAKDEAKKTAISMMQEKRKQICIYWISLPE